MSKQSIADLGPAPRQPVVSRLGANNAFIGACQDFDALMAKLVEARARHFGVDTETSRDWSDVGSLAQANATLASALAFLTGTAA